MGWTIPATFGTNETPLSSTKLNTHLRDNMRELWHRVARVEFTGTVTATPGTHVETAPLDIVSAGAIVFGGFPIIIKVGAPLHTFVSSGSAVPGISIWDTVDLGRLATVAATSQTSAGPFYEEMAYTPSAASHTFVARIWAAAGTSATIAGGAGGVGVSRPGFIEIWEKGGA